MKQLIIVRHGKSDWENHNLKDFDRPLNSRGHKNAPMMVQRLVKQGFVPDSIVSSPALRAITTANYFAAGWAIEPLQINKEAAIYEANAKTLLSVVNNLSDDNDIVALFGHNPGLTELISYFTDEYVNMTTCSVAVIAFPFDEWKLVSAQTGNLEHFDFPKSGMD